MKYATLCSGIEACSVAWHPLGWEPVYFSEIEPFPKAVLKHHYPNVPDLGDMTLYQDWKDYGTIDLICAGTPCQAFSVAGLREGLADPRGNLTLVFLGVLAKYRPKWVVWENVPGVLSDRSNAFGQFVAGLSELGYGVAWRVLDAQYFGVAQRRRRVFVVGYLGDWRPAAAVLFEPDCLRGNPPPSRQKGQGAADFAESSIGTFRQTPAAGTLKAHGGKDGGGKGYLGSDDTAFTVATHQDQHIAQPIPIDLRNAARDPEKHDEQNRKGLGVGDEGDPAHTVTSAFVHGVAQPIILNDQGGSVMNFSEDGLVGTLRRETHGHEPIVAQPVGVFMAGQGAKAGGIGYDESLSPTLKSAASGTNLTPTTHIGMVVRRLTPTECERLQGFPDGYTNIPWRNKPESPDGPRYKALGNSMAVPVMRWIGERIKDVDDYMKARGA